MTHVVEIAFVNNLSQPPFSQSFIAKMNTVTEMAILN
jgi:hypothetical protein